MIGGSSAGSDGLVGAGVPPTNLLDGDDVMHGGPDADTMPADNAIIIRPVDGNGLWLRMTDFGYDIVVRQVIMSQTPESGGANGDRSPFVRARW